MDMNSIIIAAVVIAAVGIIVGVGLGLFGAKFKVEVDEKEAAVREELPGNNCGGCGYPGCDASGKGHRRGQSSGQCMSGRRCSGRREDRCYHGCRGRSCREEGSFRYNVKVPATRQKYSTTYHGIDDCAKASVVPGGGAKACSYGCTGFGSCVKACQFDAIHVVDGVAVVDKEKCVACGACVAACPKAPDRPGTVQGKTSGTVQLPRSWTGCQGSLPGWLYRLYADVPSSVSLTQSIWITT